MTNEKQLLNNPDILLTDEVLRENMRELYTVFTDMRAMLTEQGMSMDWKFYRDSKAWLCKVSYKKRTNFWLSVWEGYFRVNFYFMPRHLEGIAALNIEENHYELAKEWGKMIPLSFFISRKEQLPDLLKVVEFKKKAK